MTKAEIEQKIAISIHALRGEGDTKAKETSEEDKRFQSTPSVGRATTRLIYEWLTKNISIHALRGEGDKVNIEVPSAKEVFQSTPSVGRATYRDTYYQSLKKLFQSTPSVGRATL